MPISNPYNYLGGLNFQPIAMPNAPTANWQGSVANGIDTLTNALQSYYDRQQKQAMLELERQKTAGEIAANAAAAERNKYLMNKTKTDDATIAGIPMQKDVNVDSPLSPFIANPSLEPAPAVPQLIDGQPVLGPQVPDADVANKFSYQTPTSMVERQAYIADPKNVGAFATPEGQNAAKLSLNADGDPSAREGAGKFSEWAATHPKASLDEFNAKAQEIESGHPGFTQTTSFTNIMNGHKASIDDLRAQENSQANHELAVSKNQELNDQREFRNGVKTDEQKSKLASDMRDSYFKNSKEAKLLEASSELDNIDQILNMDPAKISGSNVVNLWGKFGQLDTGGKPGQAMLKKMALANGGALDKAGNIIESSLRGDHALTANQIAQLKQEMQVYKNEKNRSHDSIYNTVTKDFGSQLHQLEPNASPEQYQQDSTQMAPHRIPMSGFDPADPNANVPKRKVWDPSTGKFIEQ